MNQVAELMFIASGVVIALIMVRRHRRLDLRQRNVVAAAVFGLFLCGRHAALVEGITGWIFVIACAGMMVVVACENLGFGTAGRTAAE